MTCQHAPRAAGAAYGPGRLQRTLIEKARGLELEDIGPDLQRILISAQELLELIDRLLGVDGAAGHPSGVDFSELQAKLRHDLRNPLNAIKGYAELLLEELDEVGAAATTGPGSASHRRGQSPVASRGDHRLLEQQRRPSRVHGGTGRAWSAATCRDRAYPDSARSSVTRS